MMRAVPSAAMPAPPSSPRLPLPLRRARAWIALLSLVLVLTLLPGAEGLAARGPAAGDGSSGGGGGLPPGKPQAGGDAGSLQLANVRVLGVPTIVVATPTLSGEGKGPTALERAKVIEGNLDLLYQAPNRCTPGERLGGLVAARHGEGKHLLPCDFDHLGLGGRPDDLQVVVLKGNGLPPQLAAVVPGRERPLPLLSVTEEDARLHGTTAERLAERWRSLLEQRLRYARLQFEDDRMVRRLRQAAISAVVLVALLALCLWLWNRTRQRIPELQLRHEQQPSRFDDRVLHGLQGRSRLLTALMAVLAAALVAVLLMAWPGQFTRAADLLTEPAVVAFKLLVMLLLVALLRGVVWLLLSQWALNVDVPVEARQRRAQRYRSLLVALQRLANLLGTAVGGAWIVAGIPLLSALSSNALLAGGAVLGALALVFQGMLRDFIAGLVALVDDRYAIGDQVEIGGLLGDVLDVGVLSTEVRTVDQKVVVVPNSGCDRIVNHTKLRSGAEVTLLLDRERADLPRALAAIEQERQAFATDPAWQPLLLEPPVLRGIRAARPEGLELSLVLVTQVGRQGEAQRELLRRLLLRLQREGIPLGGCE